MGNPTYYTEPQQGHGVESTGVVMVRSGLRWWQQPETSQSSLELCLVEARPLCGGDEYVSQFTRIKFVLAERPVVKGGDNVARGGPTAGRVLPFVPDFGDLTGTVVSVKNGQFGEGGRTGVEYKYEVSFRNVLREREGQW